MSLTNGPNLGLIENGALGEQHYAELMRLWRGIDALVQPTVNSATTVAPPKAPVNGERYLIPVAATGAWRSHTAQIARWTTMLTTAGWEFFTPKAGWNVRVIDQPDAMGCPALYTYNGKAWVSASNVTSVTSVTNVTNVTTAKAAANLHASHALPAATFTKVALDTVEIDTDKIFSVANHRFTPKMPGWYQVAFLVTVNKDNTPSTIEALVYKNDVAAISGMRNDAAIGIASANGTKLLYFDGETDYCDLQVVCGNASGTIVAGPAFTYMNVVGPI